MESIQASFESLKKDAARIKEDNERLEKLNKQLEKEIQQLKAKGAQSHAGNLKSAVEKVGSVDCLIVKTDEEMDPPLLRSLADKLKEPNLVLLLVDPRGFCVAASGELVKDRIPAGEILKVATTVAGGSGGGRPDMAQGRINDPAKLPEIKQKEKEFITQKAKG